MTREFIREHGVADRVFAASSMEGGLRCAGTSEFNHLDAEPDWRRARILRRLGKALLPGLNVEHASEWMGRRPTLPDTIPVIGAVPGHPQVILAFGHGHLGLTGAPMTGRMVTALATTCTAFFPLKGACPVRRVNNVAPTE